MDCRDRGGSKGTMVRVGVVLKIRASAASGDFIGIVLFFRLDLAAEVVGLSAFRFAAV